MTFQRRSTPVFYPDNDLQKSLEWPGGCEDPRIAVTVDGLYVMMYTQWNRDIPRLAVATSKDLVHWTKYGPAFAKAYDGKFYNMACKSGSILTELIDGRQVIKKVGGKYFMYWGEEHVFAATSEDLVNWTPIVNIDGSLKRLFSPRDGYFDSQLTECGPPAIYTPKGIVLLYNGKNHSGKGDKRYTPNVYAAGQALFDANDPTHLISRLDEPFSDQWILSRKVDNMLMGLYSLKEWFILKGNGICIMAVPIQRLVSLFTTLRILLYLTHCHKRYYFC